MALPDFSMRQLLEAGVHFGHQTHRWNPKMDRYIFGKRNNIHILDLSQTVPLLHTALKQISDTVARGGRVLFVGTKRQASELVADAARRSAQYYVNARWLGGMLTNWKTISNSIKRLRELETLLDGSEQSYTKRELLSLTRERDKLERALGGIKDMGGVPDLIVVVDTNKEAIAVQEANKLKIPVCAILDSNSDTDGIDLPIPGNDDASRAIALYCDLIAKAAIDGLARQQGASGADLGARVDAPRETVLDDVSATASNAASTVADTASSAASSAAETASGIASTVAQTASTGASSIMDAVSAAASRITEAASSAVGSASDAAPGLAASAKETASNAADAATAAASSAADSAAAAASNAAEGVTAATSKGGETLSESASAAVDAAADSALSAAASVSTATAKLDNGIEKTQDGPLFKAPEGAADDLKRINGIGPVAERQLQEQGITTYAQIAALTPEEVQKVDDYMPFSTAQVQDWKAQAADLSK